MKKKNIIFTLDTKVPATLSAEYNGRKASVGIAIVPAVMEAQMNGKVLLFEEEVGLAEEYLKTILYFPPYKANEKGFKEKLLVNSAKTLQGFR